MALKSQLVEDPNKSVLTMSPTQIETALKRVLADAPNHYLATEEDSRETID